MIAAVNICDYYDIDIKVAFDFCIGRGWALPFGVRTFLRVEQEEEMLDALGWIGIDGIDELCEKEREKERTMKISISNNTVI